MSNLLNTLENILEAKEEKKVEGTYVGALFSDKTKKDLEKLIKDINVPNPLSSDKFHTTIMYSITKFNYEAEGKLDPVWIGKPVEFDIFTSKDGKNCLVLKYTCDKQKKRHEHLRDNYNATYTFPEYKLHITLSYDCSDFDYKSIRINDYIKKIEIIEEYEEPLEIEWNKKDSNE